MPRYQLHVTGVAQETYEVEAASPVEAEAMFERGEVTKPVVSEVESAEVQRVVLVTEDAGRRVPTVGAVLGVPGYEGTTAEEPG